MNEEEILGRSKRLEKIEGNELQFETICMEEMICRKEIISKEERKIRR